MKIQLTGKNVGPVLQLERLRQVFPRFVRQDVGWFLVVKDLPNEPDDFCAVRLIEGENKGTFFRKQFLSY